MGMEQTAVMYARVKARGMADGMTLDAEIEDRLRKDILKEVLTRHILKCINNANSSSYEAGSVDAGLLATPQGYFGGDLNELSADCVRGLMERGFGVQDDFVDWTTLDNAYRELELIEFDGKMSEVTQQKVMGVRSDKVAWLMYADLDREDQPGLSCLFKKMISIPFELNKKCNLCLQANATFQAAHFGSSGFYKKHMDGGYHDDNNGRKITAVFFVGKSGSAEDGGQLRMYKRRRNPYAKDGNDVSDVDTVDEDIMPRGMRLVLFRSRDMPHEFLASSRKRFTVTLWLMGPPGPGDQPDGHYTPA